MTTQRTELRFSGGREYLLRAERVPEGLCGTWYCPQCHRFEILEARHGTAQQALEAASDRLRSLRAQSGWACACRALEQAAP